MKLKSKSGKFIMTDGERCIVFDMLIQAIEYMFLMLNFRTVRCVPPSLCPVRTLTPNPKAMILTHREKIKISIVKANMPICTI